MGEARTKIVATVGPACRDAKTLEAMIRAGTDVFRVNGAHATPEEAAEWVRRIHRAAGGRGCRPVAALVDLPGPKIRVGAVGADGGLDLEPGRRVVLAPGRGAAKGDRIPVDPMPAPASVPAGTEVLAADGRLRLKVVGAEKGGLLAEVVDGGRLPQGAGVHFRNVSLPLAVPTEADRRMAQAAVKAGADLVSQSFVRNADDVVRLRETLEAAGGRGVGLVAKIERLEAVSALDEILAHSDAAMVARGDLGVDAGPERVPTLQIRILEAGRRAARPVIVATEMLESMVERVRPTRAEASDVATAVFQAADAVMLSQETAIGAHPALVVETMGRILEAAEADPHAPYAGHPGLAPTGSQRGRPDQHVVRAAVALARDTAAEAIVVFTRTGKSAVRMSKERPAAPIYAFTSVEAVCRRLSLAWGVRARAIHGGKSTDEILAEVAQRLRKEEGLRSGARAVLVMGGTGDPHGATTLIKLLTV